MRTLMLIAAVGLGLAAPARAETLTDRGRQRGGPRRHVGRRLERCHTGRGFVFRCESVAESPTGAGSVAAPHGRHGPKPVDGRQRRRGRRFKQGGGKWRSGTEVHGSMRLPGGISVRFELSSSSASWSVQPPRWLLGHTSGLDFGRLFAKWAGDENLCTTSRRAAALARRAVLHQCANGRDDDGDGKIDAADRGCANTVDDAEGDEPVTPRLLRPVVTPAKARPGRPVTVRRLLSNSRRRTGRDRKRRVHDPRRSNAQAGPRPDLGGGRDVQVCRAARLASDHGARHDEDRRDDAEGVVLRSRRLTRGSCVRLALDGERGRGNRPSRGPRGAGPSAGIGARPGR